MLSFETVSNVDEAKMSIRKTRYDIKFLAIKPERENLELRTKHG